MDYKIEGNIIFPDEHMLTWGPFYYHSEEKAKNTMESVLNDIVSWCNLKEPSLNIKPEKIIKTRSGDQICFDIKAWKDETHLEKCGGIVSVDPIYFEDWFMTHLIDKDALVAEIKRRMDENRGKQSLPQYFGMMEEDLNILSFINTLELKEVDLDFSRFSDEMLKVASLPSSSVTRNTEEVPLNWEYAIAKHFFELGLKARQG